MYRIESLFPTPIYIDFMEPLADISKEINDAYGNFEFNGAEKPWGKSTTTTNLEGNILKQFGLTITENVFNNHINNFIRELGFNRNITPDDYDMKCWMSVNHPNTHTHSHDHGFYDLSGVYYHETNGKDGNIYFSTPCSGLSSNYLTQVMGRHWDHEPRVGKLILFPSYLIHGVRTNETDSIRKCIAFSLSLKDRKS